MAKKKKSAGGSKKVKHTPQPSRKAKPSPQRKPPQPTKKVKPTPVIRKVKQFQQAVETFQLLSSYTKDKKKKREYRAQIADLKRASKLKGRKLATYEKIQRVLAKHENIDPGKSRIVITDKVYKLLGKREKVTFKSVYDKIVKGYKKRDVRAIDTAIVQNHAHCVWYLFSSLIMYMDSGLDPKHYKDAKQDTKEVGTEDIFRNADKKGKKIRSKDILLLRGDKVKITSNNKLLARAGLPVYNHSEIQIYHNDLKRDLVGKNSPLSYFAYRELKVDKKGHITIHYYLEDTALKKGEFEEGEGAEEVKELPVTPAPETPEIVKPEEPKKPTLPPATPAPPPAPPTESETEKLIKLRQLEIEAEKAKLATIEAEAHSREMAMRQIESLKEQGFTNKQIMKILKITP